ncbi:hypothetical protein [Candidatus Electronema sp. PJ]|uniref:hypothetical protein n=1 Tax=Candidatus Electronema sp. PJ TaxID=3401572 RepID=UPI003AA8F761
MAWQPLFRITVQHSFFRTTRGPDLEFVPTPACAQLINKAHLLLRTDGQGLLLCFDTDAVEILRSFLAVENNALLFTFDVYTQDMWFACYTDPADQSAEAVTCYDSRLKSTESTDGLVLAKTAILERRLGRKPVFTILISVSEHSLTNAVGIDYVIPLAARRTYWKYYLFGTLAEHELRIVDLQGQVQFKSAGMQMPFPDTSAVAFYSTDLIALRDRPENRFQLRQQGLRGEKVLIKRLKNAGAEQFQQECLEGKHVELSEIFINY